VIHQLPPDVSLLWLFADYFSILPCHLTLDVAHWFRRWALWTTTCPISGNDLSPSLCQPFCLSSLCLLNVHMEISSLILPPFSSALAANMPLCCVFLVPCLLFSFFGGGLGDHSVQGALLVYPRGGWRNTIWHLVLTCWSADCLPSRFGASIWQHGSPPVVSAWQWFLWDRGSGCQSFDSSYCFISAKCGSSVSMRFWSLGSHALCFCTLVAILDVFQKQTFWRWNLMLWLQSIFIFLCSLSCY
jgi:hypothetical protein